MMLNTFATASRNTMMIAIRATATNAMMRTYSTSP